MTIFQKSKKISNMLEPMNIECRYPTHKEQLLKSLTAEKCQEMLEKSKELQIWIKQKL